MQVLTEQYRKTCNYIKPHSSLGYRPPAPQTVMTAETRTRACGPNIDADTKIGGRSGAMLLDNVAVRHPERQGEGLGRQLMAFVENEALNL